MKLLACLLLVGCGRLSFDAATTDASATGDAPCAWGPFSAPSLLPGPVQSNADDWFPTPSADELQLYFYQYVGGTGDAEVVRATRVTRTDPFSAAAPVAELNSALDDTSVAMTDDGLYLVLTRDDGTTPHLYAAARATTADAFSTPVMIGELFLAGVRDLSPALSSDGTRMVFASGRTGTNMLELFETTRASRAAAWGVPQHLMSLSSPAQDDNPTLSADGLELFFSSQRDGRDEVYRATRPALDQPFSTPVVVSELSSPLDEVGTRLSRDGRTMYFAYNAVRGGGQNAQIWTATRSLACARVSPTSTPAPR